MEPFRDNHVGELRFGAVHFSGDGVEVNGVCDVGKVDVDASEWRNGHQKSNSGSED